MNKVTETYEANKVIIADVIEIRHLPERGRNAYAIFIDGIEQKYVSSFGFYLDSCSIPRYTMERLILNEESTTA